MVMLQPLMSNLRVSTSITTTCTFAAATLTSISSCSSPLHAASVITYEDQRVIQLWLSFRTAPSQRGRNSRKMAGLVLFLSFPPRWTHSAQHYDFPMQLEPSCLVIDVSRAQTPSWQVNSDILPSELHSCQFGHWAGKHSLPSLSSNRKGCFRSQDSCYPTPMTHRRSTCRLQLNASHISLTEYFGYRMINLTPLSVHS